MLQTNGHHDVSPCSCKAFLVIVLAGCSAVISHHSPKVHAGVCEADYVDMQLLLVVVLLGVVKAAKNMTCVFI